MRKRTAAGAAACLGVLVAAALPVVPAAFAIECLPSPQGAKPGYHWYYRTDRTTNRKCWYLRRIDTSAARRPSRRVQPPADRAGGQPRTSSARRPRPQRLDREALFEDFLRWQKQQENKP
jgi:hypothetical protein